MKFIRVLKSENITLDSTPKVHYKYYDTKNYPADNSTSKKYTVNDKYNILNVDDEIVKNSITKNELIKFYNDTIKNYYDSLKRDLGPSDFMYAVKDGPKITNDFKVAINGLKELGYNISKI